MNFLSQVSSNWHTCRRRQQLQFLQGDHSPDYRVSEITSLFAALLRGTEHDKCCSYHARNSVTANAHLPTDPRQAGQTRIWISNPPNPRSR